MNEERISRLDEGSCEQRREEKSPQAHEGAGAGNGAQAVGKCKYCQAVIEFNPRSRTQKTACSSACVKRAWKARNPEWARADYERNRERYKAKGREWNIANRDRKQATNREWRKANLAHALERERLRRIRDKEALKKCNARRDSVINSATPDEKAKIAQWLKEWKSMPSVNCAWCSKSFLPKECQTDHIISISRGGLHLLSNLCISCKPCNQSKANQNPEDFVKRKS